MTRVQRVLLPWTLALLGAGAGVSPAHAAAPRGAARPPAARPPAPPGRARPPRLLDEMEKDVQHFAEMVTEYRGTAREILKRAYQDKIEGDQRQVRPADRPQRPARRATAAATRSRCSRRSCSSTRTTSAGRRTRCSAWPSSTTRSRPRSTWTPTRPTRRRSTRPNPPDTPPPRVDYTPTINLYRRLLTEFPSYRFLDAAYYLLGFCLGEMGEDAAGQAGAAGAGLLEPVQAARHAGADAEAVAARAGRRGQRRRRGLLQGVHAGPEGVEVHPRGLDAHRRVPLRQPERAEARDRGLPQGPDVQGLALLRPRALQARLVVLPRQPLPRGGARVRQPGQVRRRAHGGRAEGRLRPAARGGPVPGRQLRRARLGRRHAARSDHGPAARDGVLQGPREGAARARGVPAPRRHLLRPDEVRRTRSPSTRRCSRSGRTTRTRRACRTGSSTPTRRTATWSPPPRSARRWAASYTQGQRLVPAQQGQPRGARGRAPAGRGRAADRGDQRPRRRRRPARPSGWRTRRTRRSWRSARSCTRPAPSSTRSTWPPTRTRSAATSSRRSTPTRSTTRASCQQAIAAYKNVRDSQLDNRYQEDAAFRMIKTYEEIIDDMKKAKEIDDPPIPDEKNTKPPVIAADDAGHLQEVPRGDRLVRRATSRTTASPTSSTPPRSSRCATVTGRPRASACRQIAEQYCGTKSDVGFKAYDAILQTYFIDYLVQDEEQKDCALGQLLTVAEQFGESACGKAAAAKAYLARIAQIKSSVKTMIITKRLQLSMENEEKGTNKQLTMCQSGPGGIALVTGLAAPSKAGGAGARRRRPRRLDAAGRRAGAGPDRRRQREPARIRARPPRSTTPASSTRSCSSSARRRSATSASTAATPIRSGARRRCGTPPATTTASSSSTRRSRAT